LSNSSGDIYIQGMNRQQRRAAGRRTQGPHRTSASLDELFRDAVACHQAGRLTEAAATYQAVLSADPRHAHALHLAGVIEAQLGRAAAAVELIGRAIRINDRDAAYFCHHGDACADLGRLEPAIRSYDRAIALRPHYAEAHANRGDALAALGHHDAAVASYDRATAIEPLHAEAWCNRGNPLRSLGRFEVAVASYDRALALRPDMAEAWSNRGSALLDLQNYEDAIASLDRAIALRPMLAEAWFNRGIAMTKTGKQHAAVESFDHALAVRPDHAETWSNRGVALLEMERPVDAIACYDRAILLQPDLAQAWHNRGNALQATGQFADALDAFDRAIAVRPDYPEALSERIHTRYLACDWRRRDADDAELIDLVRRDAAVAPFALLPTSASGEEQLRCARQWGRRFPRTSEPLAGSRPRDPQRRLTVGYLSGDFRQHPLAQLIVDVLEYHDRTQFEVVGYDLRLPNDSAIRRRLVAACDRFVDLSVLPDLAAAQTIANHATDILVDLSGYTTRARSGVLALRPAPIQVSYLGYIGSMGADFIDYIVADPVALPLAQQRFYDEKIVHLPVSYQPNGTTRETSPRRFSREGCGLPERGFVFCCFNTSYKIAPDVFAIWMRLLATVPDSVLWLVGGNPPAEANLRREAAERGIAPERLVFAPKVSYPEYLARCAIGDLFLDTLPYSAGATASDMLWAGLPLVTRVGTGFAGRMAASVPACGPTELITETESAYEALALRLATKPSELARVRAVLRDRVRASPLFDAARSARHLEAAYAQMWRRECDGQAPASFAVADPADAG
jgi:protein O-GlcNAc transferase